MVYYDTISLGLRVVCGLECVGGAVSLGLIWCLRWCGVTVSLGLVGCCCCLSAINLFCCYCGFSFVGVGLVVYGFVVLLMEIAGG